MNYNKEKVDKLVSEVRRRLLAIHDYLMEEMYELQINIGNKLIELDIKETEEKTPPETYTSDKDGNGGSFTLVYGAFVPGGGIVIPVYGGYNPITVTTNDVKLINGKMPPLSVTGSIDKDHGLTITGGFNGRAAEVIGKEPIEFGMGLDGILRKEKE